MGLAVAWLTTQPAHSWAIWQLLLYFGASGVIWGLIIGMRNYGWMWRIRQASIRGRLTELIHHGLLAVGIGAALVSLTSGDRVIRLICGVSLALIAVSSWATVRWADR